MKVAVAYKGILNAKKIEQEGLTEDTFDYCKLLIENHKNHFYEFFDNCDIDFYFSTYNLNQDINSLYQSEFNPKKYFYLENYFLRNELTWSAQLRHYRNLIKGIKEQNDDYDLFVFSRVDIRFLKKFELLNIDFSKFNIVLEHPSKNCDDAFWIFPKKFLNAFEDSVNQLFADNRITHEINHELTKRSVDINYMVDFDKNLGKPNEDILLGHDVFIPSTWDQ